MKIYSTNYFNTFIEVAPDSKVFHGLTPPAREKKTIATLQYELIFKNPYRYTSDDIFFRIYAERNDLSKSEYKHARERFFSKGQPCLRASPLTKIYGFGVHFNNEGKVAIFGMETREYQEFVKDPSVTKIKAMKSVR